MQLNGPVHLGTMHHSDAERVVGVRAKGLEQERSELTGNYCYAKSILARKGFYC